MTGVHDVTAPVAPFRLAEPKPRKHPWVQPVVLGVGVVAGTIYTGIKDPNTSHAFPFCPLKLVTGLDCPACGCLRAVHSLTRANVVQAADHNLLFTIATPFLVLAWGVWLARSLGVGIKRRPMTPSWVLWSGFALIIAFTVFRNLPVPVGTWLNSS